MAKIAVATSDGISINEHFGRAAFFRVYEIKDGRHSFVELRDATAVRQQRFSHNHSDFDRIIELLSDCDAVFASKIGEGAAAYLISKGVRVFEVNGEIDAVFEKIIEDKIFE